MLNCIMCACPSCYLLGNCSFCAFWVPFAALFKLGTCNLTSFYNVALFKADWVQLYAFNKSKFCWAENCLLIYHISFLSTAWAVRWFHHCFIMGKVLQICNNAYNDAIQVSYSNVQSSLFTYVQRIINSFLNIQVYIWDRGYLPSMACRWREDLNGRALYGGPDIHPYVIIYWSVS
jgi:hypothetical protein